MQNDGARTPPATMTTHSSLCVLATARGSTHGCSGGAETLPALHGFEYLLALATQSEL